MPLSPFHWGISILIQSVLIFMDPVALFIGSVIPDIEGITAWYIFPNMGLPLHGPLHSFTGAIVLGIITGIGSWLFFKYFLPLVIKQLQITPPFSIPKYSIGNSLSSALIGTFSHIGLDAPLYSEMDLLYPMGVGNPLYQTIPGFIVYLLCIIGFVVGSIIIVIRLRINK